MTDSPTSTRSAAAPGSPAGRLARAVRAALPVAVLALAPFLVFAPVWLGPARDMWHFAGDTTGSYWPDLLLHWHALREGTFPLWNPYDRAGYPFCADPQTAVLYPVDWLLALVALGKGGLPYSLLTFKVLAHLGLAGVALYTFLRGRGLSRTAGVAGGLSWQMSAWLLHNAHFALAWPAAWFPFVLWGADRLCRRPSWGAGAALGAFGGLLVLAGSPPAAFYAGLVAGPYLVFRLVQEGRARGWRPALRAIGPPLALAAVVAFALALPNLWATVVLTRHSVLEERDFGFVASGSLSPVALPGLFVRSAEKLYLYLGLSVVALAAVGLWRGRPRATVGFFAAVALAGVLLAFGSNALPLRALYHLVPGFDLFRLAFRYLFLTSIGLAVLAAYGVAAVNERAASDERTPDPVLRLVAGAAAALASFALLGTVLDKSVGSRPVLADLWFGALVMGALAAVLALRARGGMGPRAFAAALVALLLVDLGTHAWRADLLRRGQFRPDEKIPAERVEALRAEQRRDHSRVYAEFALNWRPGTRHALYDFRGYMDPLRLRRYADVIDLAHRHPAVLGRFAVSRILHAPHPYHGVSHHHVKEPGRIPGVKREGAHEYVLPDPAPYAYWVGGVRLVDAPDQALKALPELPRDVAVVARQDLDTAGRLRLERLAGATPAPADEPTAPARTGAGPAAAPAAPAAAPARAAGLVAAEVTASSLNGVTLAVTAPADGLLVVNEAWFPGWQARVDGAAAPVIRANHLVQAVPLPAGRHEVTLRFRPAYFVWPAWGAALTALLLLAAAAFARLRRPRPGALRRSPVHGAASTGPTENVADVRSDPA